MSSSQATHYDENHLFKQTQRGLFRWNDFEWVKSTKEVRYLKPIDFIEPKKPMIRRRKKRRDYSHVKALIMETPMSLSQVHDVLGGDKRDIKSAIGVMMVRGEIKHVGYIGRVYTYLVNKDYDEKEL